MSTVQWDNSWHQGSLRTCQEEKKKEDEKKGKERGWEEARGESQTVSFGENLNVEIRREKEIKKQGKARNG